MATPIGQRPPLSSQQWKALEYELAHPRASLRRIAEYVGASHETVRQWRVNPDYERGQSFAFAEQIVSALKKSDQKNQEKKKAMLPRRLQMSPAAAKRDSDANLEVHIRENWTGPTESPLDGKVYNDPDCYLQHIKSHPTILWAGDLPEYLHGKKK